MAKLGDPRLGELLAEGFTDNVEKRTKVALLGYPCDLGVARNSGRIGAALGPECFRKKLSKLGPLINPEKGIDLQTLIFQDRGNTRVTDNLEANHISLTKDVQQICEDGFVGVIVGGGNDQSYCNAKGLMRSLKSGRIGVVNVDAHLDVRPLAEGGRAHSGSPFRQLLEDKQFQCDQGMFVEYAVQGNQCSSQHANYVTENGGKLVWLSEAKKENAASFSSILETFDDRPTFISFDIDSIQGSDCPGVSCPAVRGLTVDDALDICYHAGKHSYTRLMDFSEYNPKIEEDRTARLLVTMVYYFLMGLADRKET